MAVDPMRAMAPLLMAILAVSLPRLAGAQEHGAGVVDLAPVESSGQQRSAFGRVMDVMIGVLVEQQRPQARPDAHALSQARLPLQATRDRSPKARASQAHAHASQALQRGAGPRIDIELGDRFALPPATAIAAQSDASPR